MNKIKKYKNKTINEVLAMNPEETIKAHTYNKYMGRAITLFDFAVNNENMDKNPAIGLKMKTNKKNADAREIFTPENLKNIFNSPGYKEDKFKKAFQYWTPVIALFTGARQNEVAQLYLSDFQKYEGIGRCQASCRLNIEKISCLPQHLLMTSDGFFWDAHSRP